MKSKKKVDLSHNAKAEKRSGINAFDASLAESKKRFDDAVQAEVEIRLREIFEDDMSKTTVIDIGNGIIAKITRETTDDFYDPRKEINTNGKTIVEPINRHGVELRSYKHFYNKDGVKDASLLETVPKDPRHIYQPTSTFHSLTSEAMSHISDLQIVVDNLIDQLEPVLRPLPPSATIPTSDPCQVGSQFTEFLDSVIRRTDVIRDRVSETMSRLSI